MTDSLAPEDLAIDADLRERYAPYLEPPRESEIFENPWEHPPLPGLSGVLKWKLSANPHRASDYRAHPVQMPADGLAAFARLAGPAKLFWIGHASFLVSIDGVNVLTDPIFGRAGGLVRRVTPPAALPEELPPIAAVVITHGHHDHLDPSSLKRLAQHHPDAAFVVPRGLSRTLPSECRRTVELSWWQHVRVGALRVHLVPAQHWHQRSPFDKNESLWGGFVLEGTQRVYHAGDTGYFGGFRAIGEVFEKIDAACLPLGAYEPSWFMSTQHMSPRESLLAFRDLGARHFVGMHWGAFDLSDEPVDAGPRWLNQTVREEGWPRERIHVIRPGGAVAVDHDAATRLFPFEDGETAPSPSS